MRAGACGLLFDVDAVDVAGGPSQFEHFLGAVGGAAATSRKQEESLRGGAFVDGVEGRGRVRAESEQKMSMSVRSRELDGEVAPTFEAAFRQQGQQC